MGNSFQKRINKKKIQTNNCREYEKQIIKINYSLCCFLLLFCLPCWSKRNTFLVPPISYVQFGIKCSSSIKKTVTGTLATLATNNFNSISHCLGIYLNNLLLKIFFFSSFQCKGEQHCLYYFWFCFEILGGLKQNIWNKFFYIKQLLTITC